MANRVRHRRNPDELTETRLGAAYPAWDQGRTRLAFRLFLLLATETDDEIARNTTGHFFSRGIGVRRDETEAMRWYKRVYRSGSEIAATNVGLLFLERRKTPAALRWFRRAIASGHHDAALNITKVYLEENKPKMAARYLKMVLSAQKYVIDTSREEAAEMLDQIESSSNRPHAARRTTRRR